MSRGNTQTDVSEARGDCVQSPREGLPLRRKSLPTIQIYRLCFELITKIPLVSPCWEGSL